MKKKVKTILISVFCCVLFLILFFGLSWHPVVAGVVSVVLYIGLLLLFVSQTKEAAEEEKSTDDLEEILKDARKDLKQLSGDAAKIKDLKVKSEALKLHQTGLHIYEYLREHPKKIRFARKFFLYYLDMSAGILQKYTEFQSTGLDTLEVREILNKTAEALPVLNDAFEKQYTRLMEGEMMDVEADITVLNHMLKMEGLE